MLGQFPGAFQVFHRAALEGGQFGVLFLQGIVGRQRGLGAVGGFAGVDGLYRLGQLVCLVQVDLQAVQVFHPGQRGIQFFCAGRSVQQQHAQRAVLIQHPGDVNALLAERDQLVVESGLLVLRGADLRDDPPHGR